MIFRNLGDVSQIIFIEFYVLTVRIASIFFFPLIFWVYNIGNGTIMVRAEGNIEKE